MSLHNHLYCHGQLTTVPPWLTILDHGLAVMEKYDCGILYLQKKYLEYCYLNMFSDNLPKAIYIYIYGMSSASYFLLCSGTLKTFTPSGFSHGYYWTGTLYETS